MISRLRRLFSGGRWIYAGIGPEETETLCNGYYKQYDTTRHFHTGTCEWENRRDHRYVVYDQDGHLVGRWSGSI